MTAAAGGGGAAAIEAADTTIVVTGAGGFVGAHLLPVLARRFPRARLLRAGRGTGNDIAFNLAEPGTAAAVAAAAPDVVVHLAGEASVARAGRDAATTWATNLVGTMALARACPRATFLFASSAEVYGGTFLTGAAATEDMPCQPVSTYGNSKLATELMLGDVLARGGTLIVARPSNHIGAGQDARFAVPSFARQIADAERRGSPATIRVGNLDAERDFLDVDDVAGAYADLFARFHGTGGRRRFNIASDRTRPVRALLDMLVAAARVDCTVEVDRERWREAEVPRAAVSPAAIAAETGWHATTPLEVSLMRVLDDARSAPDTV